MKRKNPLIFRIPNYNPRKYDKEQLKKWCVEQANLVTIKDDNQNSIQPDIIKTAQKIYDWVTK